MRSFRGRVWDGTEPIDDVWNEDDVVYEDGRPVVRITDDDEDPDEARADMRRCAAMNVLERLAGI